MRILGRIVFVLLVVNIASILGVVITIPCAEGILCASQGGAAGGALVTTHSSQTIFGINRRVVCCCVSGKDKFLPLLDDLRAVNRKYEVVNRSPLTTRSMAILSRSLIRAKYPSVHLIIAGIESEKESDSKCPPGDLGSKLGDGISTFHLNRETFEILPGGAMVDQSSQLACSAGGLHGTSLDLLLKHLYQVSCTDSRDQAAGQKFGRSEPSKFLPATEAMKLLLNVLKITADSQYSSSKSPIQFFLQSSRGLLRIPTKFRAVNE